MTDDLPADVASRVVPGFLPPGRRGGVHGAIPAGVWPRGSRTTETSGPGAAVLLRGRRQAWAALSSAAHFHPYELLPTREELLAWDEVVMEVVEATEREWR